jgi:hypothetical protein
VNAFALVEDREKKAIEKLMKRILKELPARYDKSMVFPAQLN